jgi:hypothetical protein
MRISQEEKRKKKRKKKKEKKKKKKKSRRIEIPYLLNTHSRQLEMVISNANFCRRTIWLYAGRLSLVILVGDNFPMITWVC